METWFASGRGKMMIALVVAWSVIEHIHITVNV